MKKILFGNWDPTLHENFNQIKRIIASEKVDREIISINPEVPEMLVQGSDPNPYHTTLTECTCIDFLSRHLPCKHIYCLARRLKYLDDLPKYNKNSAHYDSRTDMEKYKQLYLDGNIDADTFVKISTALSKLI